MTMRNQPSILRFYGSGNLYLDEPDSLFIIPGNELNLFLKMVHAGENLLERLGAHNYLEQKSREEFVCKQNITVEEEHRKGIPSSTRNYLLQGARPKPCHVLSN